MSDSLTPAIQTLTQDDSNFIIAREYAEKYGLDKRAVSSFCYHGKLVAKKLPAKNPASGQVVPLWHVLDVPPEQHPDFNRNIERNRRTSQTKAPSPQKRHRVMFKQMERDAPVLLERFRENAPLEQSRFTLAELTRILGVSQNRIRKWNTEGIDGWGKLPKVKVPDSANRKYKGRLDFYFRRLDIVRFLKGEIEKTAEAETLDDVLDVSDEIKELKEEHGYYVYRPESVYPMTFEGFKQWIKDMDVRRYDKKTYQWVPYEMLPNSSELFSNVFTLNQRGLLKYKLVCISRPRGDFKSFDTCLIILFRFFNLPREKVILAANSQDQSEFVLFNELRTLLENNPRLRETPGLEIKEKGIFLYSGKKEVFSSIQTTANKFGIFSNATCIAFSEIWKLKDETFFHELYGSIRAVPNSMIVIESTVAPKGHLFHNLYKNYQDGKDPLLYFQYYGDKHYNPDMTKEELESFRVNMYEHEYNRFFRNRWEDAVEGFFAPERITEMGLIGVDGEYGRTQKMVEVVTLMTEKTKELHSVNKVNQYLTYAKVQKELQELKKRVVRCDDVYSLPATMDDLRRLKEMFGCNFIIGMGIDRARIASRNPDRTAIVTVARGIITEFESINFIIDIFMPDKADMPTITERILMNTQAYGWIDAIDCEEYQMQDLYDWCVRNGYNVQLLHATNKVQDEIFRNMYLAVKGGYLKCPSVPLWVDQEGQLHRDFSHEMDKLDILREEMSVFNHNPDSQKNRYGAPKKRRKGEPLDDTVYATAWALRACYREEVGAGLIGRKVVDFCPDAIVNTDVVGRY